MQNKKKLIVKEMKINSKTGFSLLSGINRPITPHHVTKMATSLEKIGVKRPVIVANIKFITGAPVIYIIDGQHLYHALIRLGWDIPYTETDINDPVELAEQLAMLNNSSKSWSMVDYITVWANVNHDYKTLNMFYNTYDIELTQLADILMNNSCLANLGGNNNISGAIKKGEFVIKDEQKATVILNYVTDVLKIIPRMDRLSNKLFISSYVNTLNSAIHYDHKQFLVDLKLNKDKFKLATQDPEEYTKLLRKMIH